MQPQTKLLLVSGLMMSGVMSLALSGFFTWLNLGFSDIWPKAWLSGFLVGWPIAFVLATLVAKPINILARRFAGN